MARAWFGGGVADFVITAPAPGDPLRFASASLTFWDAETGGTQHTDLLREGVPVTSIYVGTDGQVPSFQGPNDVLVMWATAGGESRVQIVAAGDIVTRAGAAVTAAEQSAAEAEEAKEAAEAVGATTDAQVGTSLASRGLPTDGDELAGSFSRLLDNVSVSASGALARQKLTKVDATAAARAMTIPDGTIKGESLVVEKTDSSTNTVTVTGKIRTTGAGSITLSYQYETLLLVWGGTYWEPMAGHRTKSSLEQQLARTEIGEAAAASTQRIMAKLKRGISSASIVIAGDSTTATAPANLVDRWPYKVAAGLAAMFPAYTVKICSWEPNQLSGSGINNYGSFTTIQTGTGTGNAGGPFELLVYVFGVGNSSTDYHLGWIDRGITAIQPDLALVSHGHNEQETITPFIASPTQYKGQYLAFTESIRAVAPGASICVIGQNPDPTSTASSNEQAVRASEYQLVAESKGYGFIDLYQAFIDYGPTWPTDLMQSPTDKHPNAAGTTLEANEILKAFTYRRNQPSRVPLPSSLLEPTEPLNYNPEFFDDWPDAAAGPVGYRVVGGTATKVVIDGEEALKLTATGAAPCYLEFRAPARRYRGRPVNVAVRLRKPAGSTDTGGSVQIGSSINTNGDPTSIPTWRNARSKSIVADVFSPVVLQHNVLSTASWIIVRVYADTANTSGATIYVTRAILKPGILPSLRSSVKQSALPAKIYANPAALPRLLFAWEADDFGGVHGDPITSLVDTSGTSHTATQATSSRRATVDTSALMNGHRTAKFTAANNQNYLSTLIQPSKVTQIVAYRSYVSGSFIGNSGITTLAQAQENTLAHLGRNPADRRLTYPTGVTLDTAGNHLIVMRYDYDDGTYEMWLDGMLIGARDQLATVLNPAAAYIIGAWRDTSTNQPLEANVAGVWISDGVMSDRERRGAQDMLATRYGVTLLDRV